MRVRRLINVPVLALLGILGVLVVAIVTTPPSAKAATVTPGICRATMIFDRSGSVGQTGIQTMQAQVRRLFEPTGLYDDKIQLAFWSFSDGNHLFRLPAGVPDFSYDTPGHDFVSSKGTDTGFDAALSALASNGGTNYEEGFGYDNGTRNANLGNIPDNSDIIVFMTDGKPNIPGVGDGNAQAVAAGRAAALHYINAGKVVLGGLVGADVDANTLAAVINGDPNNHTNLFTISSDYNDLSSKLKDQIGTQCDKLTPPCQYNPAINADDPNCKPPAAAYNLVPATSTDSTVISSNDSATLHYSVTNTSPDVTSPASNWTIKQVVVDKDQSADPLSFGTDSYRDGYSCAALLNLISNKGTCQDAASGSKIFPPGVTAFGDTEVAAASRVVVDDKWPVGTKVCFVLTLDKPTEKDSPTNRFSKAACVVIGKRPTVQVYGGDLMVGRRFADDPEPVNTLPSTVEGGLTIKGVPINRTFGNWVEYGIFAPGEVNGVASASGLAGGYPATTGDIQALWSSLTFSNDTNQYGYFSDPQTIPDGPSAVLSDSHVVGDVTNDSTAFNGTVTSGIYQKLTGDLTLNQGNLDRGSSVIVYVPNGTVTIAGNLTYTDGPYTSIADIPRLVVIARNINIQAAVTEIDGWLVARNSGTSTGDGTIDTCSDGPVMLSINDCSQTLRINGPVMSRHLLLRRTAGSGIAGASGDPAEIIDLRADTFLSSLPGSGGVTTQTTPTTTYTTELPPRF